MVSNSLMRIVAPCWRPSIEGENSGRGDVAGRVDGLLWYKDSGRHVNGDFSMAVIQANNVLEDHSRLDSGPLSSLDSGPQGTFVGIYDGHGGPEASRFVNSRLFDNLKIRITPIWSTGTVVYYLHFARAGEQLKRKKMKWLLAWGRAARGWGVEWPMAGLCSILGGVLPAGQCSSGRRQWEQLRRC
ncbi:putative protein phosphatase 2C 38 [Vitis vinifera]|uniref:Uncharacterized protein n=1 Tax=Vitis vinifera TaxID=29760 RepID=A0A438CB88_VITVI|nr:putative protein phosphatase 2C 38 [Vitis vinifera]